MEAALGIRAPAPASAAASTARSAVKEVVNSWREAAGMWKRLRTDEKTSKGTERDAIKRVKREGCGEAEVWQRLPDSSPARPSDIPAWAVGLEAVLERCRDLIESPKFAVAARQQERGRSLRAALTTPSAKEALSASLPVQPVSSAAVAAAPVAPLDSHAALLREAELICSRERTETLLPLYAELHVLRRMRAEREQEAAHKVEEQLQWEQLRLTDMLAECDAQLEMLDSNFLDSCKARLAPLEMLQQRIDALHKFRRQLETHAAAMLPLPLKGAAVASKNVLTTPELATHAPRPVGLVGDALSQRMSEERVAWRKKVEALQARLDAQKKRNAELQACYMQANLQLQTSLDRDNYVNKEVLNALKAQNRADMEALVEKLGWTLINNTFDVLSLRHPGSGATLHVNHAYSTINGQTCEDVVKALAAYILKHRNDTAPTVAPAAALPVNAPEAVKEGTLSEGHASSTSLHPTALPADASYLQSGTASMDAAMRQEASQGTEEAVPTVTEDAVAQAESASPSASAHEERASAASEAEVTAAEEPLMRGDSASMNEEVAEVSPQSPASSGTAAESTGEGTDGENDAQEARGGAAASSDGTRERDDGGDDVAASEEEGDSADDDEEGGDGGVSDAEEEDLAGYSNLQTEEGSGNTSTLNVSANLPSSGSKGSDAWVTPVQPAPYESFFSSNQLWESEDE
ncbi:conserved hypothetical protein [Leishmania mexicana MHOM/GT/2001/U1103]|uniref:Uncharacterized protein n=1 Tax=Leishmania mexicana (strain MHOM/GT/2001/U1103) TaxID=929439 RepID=E9AYP1_LEIMU|nr:conserved hypothetical protein [Leishmania mexicana MHOM/GT/2001/U1103]CBZ28084.1 conserved hypothetical protein [Leishmania mexicana MHOM/GT/2001/U1103]